MVQGLNKSFIFNNEMDIKYYIKLMYELKQENNVKIIAYCIMNNHAHILLKTENISNLSKYMQRINIRFSIYYNKKYNKIGYVFRDRFKSQGIYTRQHLFNCIRYIFENPVKAGICDKAEEYPFSNARYVKELPNIGNNMQYYFLDTEEDIEKFCEDSLNEVLSKNNIKMDELINNKLVLKEIVNIMKNQYNYSLRNISNRLNINREKIRKIFLE